MAFVEVVNSGIDHLMVIAGDSIHLEQLAQILTQPHDHKFEHQPPLCLQGQGTT